MQSLAADRISTRVASGAASKASPGLFHETASTWKSTAMHLPTEVPELHARRHHGKVASESKTRLARIAPGSVELSCARESCVCADSTGREPRACAPVGTPGRPEGQWSPSSSVGTLALSQPSTQAKEGPHGQVHRNRRARSKLLDRGCRCAWQARWIARRRVGISSAISASPHRIPGVKAK
jgi:hypothetical protein